MFINCLPDDCLIHLFRQLALAELVPLRIVCHRWNSNIGAIFRSKQSLKVCGPSGGDATKRGLLLDLLEFKPKPQDSIQARVDLFQFDMETFNRNMPVCSLFPNVTNLVFYCYPAASLSMVKDYPNLTGLYLRQIPYECADALWPLLRSMSLLKHLHLFFSDYDSDKPNGELSLLSRLEHFSLVNYEHGDEGIGPLLRQLGPKLKKLLLANVACSLQDLRDWVVSSTDMGSNLTRLTLGYIHLDLRLGTEQDSAIQFLAQVCSKFTRLQYLNIVVFNRIPFSDTVLQLANLSRLTEVVLLLDQTANLDYPQLCQLPPLKSLETMHLKSSVTLLISQLKNVFPVVFPGLLKVYFLDSNVEMEDFAELVNTFRDVPQPRIMPFSK